MATKQVEMDAQDEISTTSVATAGDDLTKTTLVEYDDTKSEQEIMDALEKCKAVIVEELSGT